MYKYGMRVTPLIVGIPKLPGFLWREDDITGKYYHIIVYDRPLNDYEQEIYELDYLGEVKE